MLLKQSIARQFYEYAKKLYPNEACGLLVSSKKIGQIDEFIPIPNQSSNPLHAFEFEPKTFLQALQQIENEKKEWISVIHSHPTSKAYPSSIDIQNWFYPDLSYWIYSLLEDKLKAYSIVGNQIKFQPYSYTTFD